MSNITDLVMIIIIPSRKSSSFSFPFYFYKTSWTWTLYISLSLSLFIGIEFEEKRYSSMKKRKRWKRKSICCFYKFCRWCLAKFIDNSDIVVWGVFVELVVRRLRWDEYTTLSAVGSEKLRQEAWVCDENSGDHVTHGQNRNTLRKPLRNLN